MSGKILTEETTARITLLQPITEPDELVIEARPGWMAIDWKEIWRYRELLYFLTWRDVKIRYKQTVLGGAWAILQPFLTMIIFSLFFGRLAGLGQKTGGIPYPIYVYSGLLAWTFFANAVTNSSNSLVGSAYLITKVYFPRLIIPLAAVAVGLVDFAVSSVVLLGMMVYYGTAITWQLLLVPVFLAATVLTATGVGTFLSALTVSYRDFRYVVPFAIQIWMFVTPVIYPITIVPARWRWLLSLNPMTGLIDGFRSAFLAHRVDWGVVAISATMSFVICVVSLIYFRRVERQFADVI